MLIVKSYMSATLLLNVFGALDEIRDSSLFVKSNYGLEITWSHDDLRDLRMMNDHETKWPIAADPANIFIIRDSIRVIKKELYRYKNSINKTFRLDKVVLCGRLTCSGHECPALTSGPQTNGQIACIYIDLNVIDASSKLAIGIGSREEYYLKRSIHHEIFHCLEYAIRTAGEKIDWSGLNLEGFEYVGNPLDSPPDPYATLGFKGPGFLTRYSLVSEEEDRAELYTMMVLHPERVTLRSANDVIVYKKIDKIASFLKEYRIRSYAEVDTHQ